MKLAYKAISQNGAIAKGIIEAKSVSEAANYLRSRQLTPIKIGQNVKPFSGLIPTNKKVSSKDLVFFTRQLSSMLEAGLTLMQALKILQKQVEKPLLKEVINNIVSQVEEGHSFSSALQKYPDTFSDIYVALIQAAESAGLMDKVLLRLSDNLEKQEKLKATVKSALVYPVIVIFMMIVVMFVMMLFVIPPLADLYQGLNVAIPLSTQIILGMSRFMQHFWFLLIFGMFGGITLFNKWHKTPSGKKRIDKWILKVPVFGSLIKKSIMSEFTRTFGLMVGTGTLVVEALQQSERVVNNYIYQEAIESVRKRVEKGIGIGDSMEAVEVFPPIVVEMTKIGEQTGKVDDSLLRVSEYFEREVELMVKNLTTLMEPFIIVILGLGVGFLIFSIITPIYSVMSAIK